MFVVRLKACLSNCQYTFNLESMACLAESLGEDVSTRLRHSEISASNFSADLKTRRTRRDICLLANFKSKSRRESWRKVPPTCYARRIIHQIQLYLYNMLNMTAVCNEVLLNSLYIVFLRVCSLFGNGSVGNPWHLKARAHKVKSDCAVLLCEVRI